MNVGILVNYRNDFTSIYQVIYPLKDEEQHDANEPLSVTNEDSLSPVAVSSVHSAAPIKITDIGIQYAIIYYYYQTLASRICIRQYVMWECIDEG